MESKSAVVLYLRLRQKSKQRRKMERQRLLNFLSACEEQMQNFLLTTSSATANFTLLLQQSSVPRIERRLWAHPRHVGFWLQKLTQADSEFKKDLRLSRQTFDWLLRRVSHRLVRETTRFREPMPPSQRLGICLWFLGSSGEYSRVQGVFGIGLSTVCYAVHDGCRALLAELAPELLSFPRGEQLREIVDGFQEDFGFPQCGGCLDGSHIPILPPFEEPNAYYNQKGWHSVVLQAVVDHRERFTSCFIGCPGRMHDARVFGMSEICRKGDSRTLFVEVGGRHLGGQNIPVQLLADSAYPLKGYLMKPFRDDGNLTNSQRQFIEVHSKTRVCVERAFGQLKNRWRCLLKRLDVFIKNAPHVVTAACLLHNVCKLSNDELPEDAEDPDPLPVQPALQPYNQDGREGEQIRNAICRFLARRR